MIRKGFTELWLAICPRAKKKKKNKKQMYHQQSVIEICFSSTITTIYTHRHIRSIFRGYRLPSSHSNWRARKAQSETNWTRTSSWVYSQWVCVCTVCWYINTRNRRNNVISRRKRCVDRGQLIQPFQSAELTWCVCIHIEIQVRTYSKKLELFWCYAQRTCLWNNR